MITLQTLLASGFLGFAFAALLAILVDRHGGRSKWRYAPPDPPADPITFDPSRWTGRP